MKKKKKMKTDFVEETNIKDILNSLKNDHFPNYIKDGFLNEKGEIVLKKTELPHYSKELENKILSFDFYPFFLNRNNKHKYLTNDKEKVIESIKILKNSNDPQSKYILALLCVDFKNKR